MAKDKQDSESTTHLSPEVQAKIAKVAERVKNIDPGQGQRDG